jgi:hypothetical protein
MNTRHRYQYGSLTRRKRIQTEDVWQFRYYETTPEGQRCRRSRISYLKGNVSFLLHGSVDPSRHSVVFAFLIFESPDAASLYLNDCFETSQRRWC